MDAFLGGLTKQAMNYAIRSGITITANYVFQQSTKLIKKVDGLDRANLLQLQQQLDDQMRIISPAIDMIELISARGNTSLESAKTLTKSLRLQIQTLGQRIAQAVIQEEDTCQSKSTRDREHAEVEIKSIIVDIRSLLRRLDFAVPLFNLAITASGANLSGTLPTTVSPSRLLQASTFLSAGDSRYVKTRSGAVQIGPTFTLSLYMLFTGHARPVVEEDVRNTTWKEVMHKARLKLLRVPLEDLYNLPGNHGQPTNGTHNLVAESRREEYAYQIIIIEDLDDDRVHTFEDNEAQPSRFQDVAVAGIREVIPVHEISKIFYADTGKILNIGQEGEMNSPILLIRRDIHAHAPRKMIPQIEEPMQSVEGNGEHENKPTIDVQLETDSARVLSNKSEQWSIPRYLDPEWLAFEVYSEAEDSEDDSTPEAISRSESIEPALTEALSNLELEGSVATKSSTLGLDATIRTSLSLLEVLLRLLSLQQFQQMSHLSVPDELLNFFLSEAATTGASNGDDVERRRIRNEARGRLGFDPYDESPIKRRGEAYQYKGVVTHDDDTWGNETFRPLHPGYQDQSSQPITPQRLLDDQPHLSPRSTPELPPLPRSSSSSQASRTTPTGAARFKAMKEQVRRGSPLAQKSGEVMKDAEARKTLI